MPVIHIDSADDPRLAVYRDLKSPLAKRRGERFVVESLLLVERLLASDLRVASVLTEQRFVDRVLPLVSSDTTVYVIPRSLVREITGFRFHRGVLACGHRPASPDLRRLMRSIAAPTTLAVCIGIQDPENLGSVIRSSAAFGVPLILLGPNCADSFSRRVARTSMGANFRVPVIEPADLAAELTVLRDEFNTQLVATVLDESARPLEEVPPAARTALLFGSEGYGLDQPWIDLCDVRVRIPMQPSIDSLNVSVAAGIFLHHFAGTGEWRVPSGE
jgi:tRNA G18 (ribose-2'-O)-methylase SpoU